MGVPDFQTLLLPLLEFAGDQQEHSMTEALDYLASRLNLSDADRNELLPSGQQRRFDNRVGWTRTHLTKAGLLETTKTKHFKITNLGLQTLQKKPPKIDILFLDQFAGYSEFRKGSSKVGGGPVITIEPTSQSPKEAIENNYQRLREDLAQELLDIIKKQSPAFFERLVIELLVKMGYGGSIQDAGQAIGKVGDEGIDGTIKEDKLGLDVIYIQAKRWTDWSVGRPDIQKFVGALVGKKARKGVFITTSTFTPDARSYVKEIDHRIVLIDGKDLAQLMMDYDVGVTQDSVYEIKKINSDYFADA